MRSFRYDTARVRRGRKKNSSLQMKVLRILHGNLAAGDTQCILEVNLRAEPVAASHPIVHLVVHRYCREWGGTKKNARELSSNGKTNSSGSVLGEYGR